MKPALPVTRIFMNERGPGVSAAGNARAAPGLSSHPNARLHQLEYVA